MSGARYTPGWGEAVRRLREARGWSQEELARRAGVAQAQVSRIEAGRQANARAETLVGLADALDVSVDALLGRGAGAAADPLAAEAAEIAAVLRVLRAKREQPRRDGTVNSGTRKHAGHPPPLRVMAGATV